MHSICYGKLRLMDIPVSFTKWIENWLTNRRGFLEINGKTSRSFSIGKGGPQGSSLTPSIFISYHADLINFLSSSTCHLFADDLATIISSEIALKFTNQCLDLEKRLKFLFNELEYYCLLSIQPINYSKTEALWSILTPKAAPFDIVMHDNPIRWTKEFKYLGYHISPRLGWSKLIHKSMIKIRQKLL